MSRRILAVGAVLAAMTIAGCNGDSVPTGTAGTVTVRAFVDADGSGAYTAADVGIPGDITLTSASGTVMHATADATGLATFTSVAPGSYTAALGAAAPAGAVLATSTTPTVVVPFKGGAIVSTFRYVFNPGTVSGVLYRDDNGNGVFDAATDTPAPGMPVALFAGTDLTATPTATTTTGAAGQFSFAGIRPGAYTLRITPIPTIQLVGGNTQAITVGASTAAAAPFKFTGNLLTPISAVRTAAAGATVAFVGVATSNAGLVGTNQLYVQDANSGVLVFGAPTAGIVTGDTVRVIGVTALFNGELEIVAPAGGTLSVTKVNAGPAPAAKAISVTQLISGAFAGQLVSVQGVRVRSVVTTGATSYNVNFQGNTAADTFQVRIGNSTNVPIASTFWEVGRQYDVAGLDGVFNGLPQLKPRAPTDVTAGLLTLTIAEARAHPVNDTVTVEGVVYAGTGVYTALTAASLSLYLQDATGGAQVFNIPTGTVINAGDSVRVRGLVTVFNSEYEIARFTATSPPVVEKLGTGTIRPARTITAPNLASKAFDGQLVRLQGLQVVSVGTPSATGGYNVVMTSPDGVSVTVRVDNANVGILNTSWVVGTRYDVTGAALNFSSNGTTFTPEFKPRSAADVSLSNVNVITIAAARAIVNDTITVEGIVTAGRGTFRVDNAYIQDATGGTQIFNIPASLNLVVGDAVRVHGKMVLFSNENEITNNIAITDSIKVTRIGVGAVPVARVLTGAQFAARTFEGQLVTVQNVTILTVGTASGTGTYTVTGTAPDGTPMTIFMSAPVGAVPPPATTFTVGSRYTLTGIAVPFGTPAGAELKPRGAADVVAQ